MQEVPGVLRWANLQDEEGNGDGDDRVAERDDPCGITLGLVTSTARPSSHGNPSEWNLATPAGLHQRQDGPAATATHRRRANAGTGAVSIHNRPPPEPPDGLAGAAPDAVTSGHTPPFTLMPLPLAWPGAVSAV